MLYNLQMTTSIAVPISGAPERPTIEISAVERRRRWLEICPVLLVAFGPPILHSLYLLVYGPGASAQVSNIRSASGLLQEATALAVLGYVLSRRGVKLAQLGFRWSLRDVGVGLLLTVLSYAAYAVGGGTIQFVHHLLYGSFAHHPSGKDFFAHPSVLFIPYTLLNPFFEELIVRAYLMTEVIELTGSSMLAVVLSVGVQSAYHLYYGWAGAASIAFFFLVLALYYVRTRRALPIIVAHAVSDVYALIRLW